jgi:hypothetical protein
MLYILQAKDIDVNKNPYSSDSLTVKQRRRPLSGGRFLDNMLREDSSRPKTAIVRPVKRSQSLREAVPMKGQFAVLVNGRAESRSNDVRYSTEKKTNSKFQPSVDYIIGMQDKTTMNSGSSPRCVSPRSPSWNSSKSKSENSMSLQSGNSSDSSDLEENVKTVEVLSKLPAKEREAILVQYVDVGDRIVIAVPQKPPKYGRKIGKLLVIGILAGKWFFAKFFFSSFQFLVLYNFYHIKS